MHFMIDEITDCCSATVIEPIKSINLTIKAHQVHIHSFIIQALSAQTSHRFNSSVSLSLNLEWKLSFFKSTALGLTDSGSNVQKLLHNSVSPQSWQEMEIFVVEYGMDSLCWSELT